MNYPIYNQDYEYSCAEILRYLTSFPHHTVYVSRPVRIENKQELTSTHSYPRDGLSIELKWECRSVWISSKLSTMNKILKMQEEGHITLVKYKIIQFSANHLLSQQASQDTTIRNIYYSNVLQSDKRQTYVQKEYKSLEYNVKKPSTIIDVFFDMLIEETAKAIEFEEYYNKLKKQRSE